MLLFRLRFAPSPIKPNPVLMSPILFFKGLNTSLFRHPPVAVLWHIAVLVALVIAWGVVLFLISVVNPGSPAIPKAIKVSLKLVLTLSTISSAFTISPPGTVPLLIVGKSCSKIESNWLVLFTILE